MKALILIIGIVALLSLVACEDQAATTTTVGGPDVTSGPGDTAPTTTVGGPDVTSGPGDTAPTTTVGGPDVTSGPGDTLSQPTAGITQEDLDKLKADIEGIEAEDLGGLSE